MQSLGCFGETQVAGNGIENPQLAESGVFQLSKVELKASKI
jgi:hypothetical protein